jgi:hypothetical protein
MQAGWDLGVTKNIFTRPSTTAKFGRLRTPRLNTYAVVSSFPAPYVVLTRRDRRYTLEFRIRNFNFGVLMAC